MGGTLYIFSRYCSDCRRENHTILLCLASNGTLPLSLLHFTTPTLIRTRSTRFVLICLLSGDVQKSNFQLLVVDSFFLLYSFQVRTERWILPFRLPSMFWWQWGSIQHWQPSLPIFSPLSPIVVLVRLILRRRSWHLTTPPCTIIHQSTHAQPDRSVYTALLSRIFFFFFLRRSHCYYTITLFCVYMCVCVCVCLREWKRATFVR